jgi:signal transduction histidine kinase
MVVLIWLLPGIADAQDGRTELSLRVLENAGGQTSIDAICCGADRPVPQSGPAKHLRSRYGGEPFWLKLEGIPDSGLVQFEPILDDVTLYARSRGSADWQIARTGDLVANEEKFFATPFMALPLPENVDPSAVYARIDQPTAVSIAATYWSLPAFIDMQNSDRTLKIFLLGFVSAIILYNLVVSVLVRDPAFALNALCIGSLLVLALYLSGYGVAYLWAGWFEYSNTISLLSMLGGVVFGAAFFFTFLRNRDESVSRFWPLFLAPAVALSVGLALLAVRAPYWAFQLTFLASAGLLLVLMAWVVGRRAVAGDLKARILLVPLFMAIGPGVVLVALDKIGGYRPVNLGNNAMEFTLAMEAILFSLALASRIRITEETNQEAAMQLLHSQQRNATIALAAQDEERQRLAKELHDSVGQEVLVIVSRLKRLARDPATAAFKDVLQDVTRMASATMDNLRRISRAMHPASIEHLGLEGTVAELLEHLNAAEEIDFIGNVALDGIDISKTQQLHIVRILQECLSNVVRHSQATHCEIDLTCRDGRLDIRVADNGIGLSGSKPERPDGFGLGLTSVDERVRSLDGDWQMRAGQERGLVVHITVPLQIEPHPGVPS